MNATTRREAGRTSADHAPSEYDGLRLDLIGWDFGRDQERALLKDSDRQRSRRRDLHELTQAAIAAGGQLDRIDAPERLGRRRFHSIAMAGVILGWFTGNLDDDGRVARIYVTPAFTAAFGDRSPIGGAR